MDWYDNDDDQNVEWIIGGCSEGVRCVNVERGEQLPFMPLPSPTAKLVDLAISKKRGSVNALCLDGNKISYLGFPMPEMTVFEEDQDVNMED